LDIHRDLYALTDREMSLFGTLFIYLKDNGEFYHKCVEKKIFPHKELKIFINEKRYKLQTT
jgi:hypothetical protein